MGLKILTHLSFLQASVRKMLETKSSFIPAAIKGQLRLSIMQLISALYNHSLLPAVCAAILFRPQVRLHSPLAAFQKQRAMPAGCCWFAQAVLILPFLLDFCVRWVGYVTSLGELVSMLISLCKTIYRDHNVKTIIPSHSVDVSEVHIAPLI